MAGTKNPLVVEPNDQMEYTEEMIKEIMKCKEDIIYFTKKFVHIVHPTKGKLQIKPTDYQYDLLNILHDEPKVCIMQPRQSFKTTTVSIFVTWYAMFHDYKNCAILANKDDTAMGILEDIKVIYENLPRWLKMPCHTYNAHTIGFINGSKIFSAATSKNGLASESVSLLYMDEVALIEPPSLAEDFWQANYPTISHGEKIFITSTPRGVGNLFHKLWKGAVEKSNNFYPFRVDWWDVPPYQVEGWKEATIKDIGLIKFNSEYGNQFLGSQATVISADALKKFKAEEPIRETDILGGSEKIWREYQPKKTYIASSDISTGSGNDYGILQIFEVDWRTPLLEDYKEYESKSEEVPEAIILSITQDFVFRSNLCSIPNFVDYVFEILPQWGNPFFIVENNGIGRSFIDRMTDLYYYENAYIHEDSPDVGIDSNVKTKTMMVNSLKVLCEKDKLILKDQDTINEMMTFVEKKSTSGNRKFRAEDGSFDDLVVSLGWACFLVDSLWFQDVLTFSV